MATHPSPPWRPGTISWRFTASAPPPAGLSITALSPSSAPAGGAAFTLTVTGTGFVSGSTVRWKGAARATTFVGTTQLRAAIPASDIAATGTATISVTNPSPAAATSNALTFTITPGSGAGSLTVTITSPKAGAMVTGTAWTTVWVGGAADGTKTVSASIDGRAAGNTTSTSSGPVSFPYDSRVVPAGGHTLSVTVRDPAGRSGTGSVKIATDN